MLLSITSVDPTVLPRRISMSIIINLTPHPITIISGEARMIIEAEGEVARVASKEEAAGDLAVTRWGNPGECPVCYERTDTSARRWPYSDCTCIPGEVLWRIPTVTTNYGEVTGLPPTKEGTVYIVSGLVAQQAPRDDVFSPGPLVRDNQGRVVGCTGLRRSRPPVPTPEAKELLRELLQKGGGTAKSSSLETISVSFSNEGYAGCTMTVHNVLGERTFEAFENSY